MATGRDRNGNARSPEEAFPAAASMTPRSRSQSQSQSSKSPKSTLPAEKVFSIQIGTELFRISGASIASDAPSYFSRFFEEQLKTSDGTNIRTLYIDRDPVTFRDIVRHLQGYHIKPKDNEQFVKLFADAQFYSLPRLISQLFESEILIQIGDRNFTIPRDIFSNLGDSPNFFSLGFAVFWANPEEVFPGLDRSSLLRPPAIVPPTIPNRSGEIFAEILHLLRGYPLHIRNEEHRADLLRDCRYYHLRGLEQKIIPHEISYNPLRCRSEIVIRLEDVRQSGVQFASDVPSSPSNTSPTGGWVVYARPFVDDSSHDLIIEIGGESTIIDVGAMRADFHGLTKARVSSLFQVVANKMNLPTKAPLGLMMMSGGAGAQPVSPAHSPLGEERVKIVIDGDTDLVVDGEERGYDVRSTRTSPGSTNSITNLIFGGGMNNSNDHINDNPNPPGIGMGGRPAKRKRTEFDLDTPAGAGAGPADTTPIPLSGLPITTTDIDLTGIPSGLPTGMERNWIVRTGQWRLRVRPNESGSGFELVFVAVKLDVYTLERRRNRKRRFLGSS